MKFLSWTKLNTLETNEQEYIDIYLLGKPRPSNVYMDLGKRLSEALEVDGLTGDPMLDLAIAQIPKLEVMEQEVTHIYKGQFGEVPLLAQLDTATEDLSAFKEYKTAIKRWTQMRADMHGQITFYATVIWLKTQKVVEDIELVGIETRFSPEGILEATGETYVIKTQRTVQDMVRMMARMQKAWKRIKELEEIHGLPSERR